MKRKLLGILQYVFFLGLGIFLVWWSARDLSEQDKALLFSSFKDTHFLLVIPVVIILMLAHYSRAIRWKMLMQPLGFHPGNTDVFLAVMIGYFFNLLLPRLGEVMKCTLLARYEKVEVDKLIGTMVAERAVDMVCLLIIIFLTVIIQADIVAEYAYSLLLSLKKGQSTGVIILRITLFASVIIFIFWLIKVLFTRFSHIGIVRKIQVVFSGILSGLSSIRNISNKSLFFAHTVFIWGMYLLSIRIGFYAMDAVSHLSFKPSMSILSFGSLGMIVTQGGIGAYQYAVQKTLLLYGILEAQGLAFGWVLWSVQTLIVLIVGLLSLLILPFVNRQANEKSKAYSK